MSDQNNIITKLNTFKNQHKFAPTVWNDRGLNPSDDEICERLEQLFNACADDLLNDANSNASPKQFKKTLKRGLSRFSSSNYDTEEREFICDYFFELSKIVNVEFNDDLNSWMYGKSFNLLMKVTSFLKGPEKIVRTLSQDCTKCNAKLETFILQEQEGIPDNSWLIIQCNSCKEYNIASMGPNIKSAKFGNYVMIEQLSKEKFNEEQALQRLEQIKFFRKN